ncbi:MAG: hypothetical protein WD073_04610, partial [Xanthobacteraceae bacterium]
MQAAAIGGDGKRQFTTAPIAVRPLTICAGPLPGLSARLTKFADSLHRRHADAAIFADSLILPAIRPGRATDAVSIASHRRSALALIAQRHLVNVATRPFTNAVGTYPQRRGAVAAVGGGALSGIAIRLWRLSGHYADAVDFPQRRIADAIGNVGPLARLAGRLRQLRSRATDAIEPQPQRRGAVAAVGGGALSGI